MKFVLLALGLSLSVQSVFACVETTKAKYCVGQKVIYNQNNIIEPAIITVTNNHNQVVEVRLANQSRLEVHVSALAQTQGCSILDNKVCVGGSVLVKDRRLGALRESVAGVNLDGSIITNKMQKIPYGNLASSSWCNRENICVGETLYVDALSGTADCVGRKVILIFNDSSIAYRMNQDDVGELSIMSTDRYKVSRKKNPLCFE